VSDRRDEQDRRKRRAELKANGQPYLTDEDVRGIVTAGNALAEALDDILYQEGASGSLKMECEAALTTWKTALSALS
jgi:hypothetical protein